MNTTAVYFNAFLCSAAGVSSSASFTLSKDLFQASGLSSLNSAHNTAAGAFGEPVAGRQYTSSSFALAPGYYAGFFGTGGTFSLVSSQVGAGGSKVIMQDGLQIGVAFTAPIVLTFSDALDQTSLNGISVQVLSDHLGQSQTPAPVAAVNPSYDSTGRVLTLTPKTAWLSNTLYDVSLTPDVLSQNGFSLNQTDHVQFLTLLDPSVDNVVIHPNIVQAALASALSATPPTLMNLRLPAKSLSNLSMILFNQNPLSAPLQVDPSVVQLANQRAVAAGGDYRTPIAYEEIAAYDLNGNYSNALANGGTLSVSYDRSNGLVPGSSVVRTRTLALWVLDAAHSQWVKLASTQNDTGRLSLTTSISRLTLFSVMGESDNSTADVYAFPTPWRPHGPNAGSGPGHSGTETDGILFSNLPSECKILIYTLAGEKVRELHHSDAQTQLPQEKWDVKTENGAPVASGVYLWRVESASDGKNGKLMVIR